ncbi:MAG TPA: LptF/LptG family permease [Spirochaetota bacterium]|nr:LptF/LptG family permease [Spirochaetota bacterium]
MKILTRYMLRSLIPNYFTGLAFFTVILLVNEVFRMVKYVVERNIPFGRVSQLFIFTVPYVLALTIPMAVVIASILTFGRMSSESEVVALRGSGISLMRILWPNLFFGIILFGVAMLFYDTVLPWGNTRYTEMRSSIFIRDPMADFEAGQVVRIGNQTLRYEREDEGTKLMHNVYITSPDGGVVFAKRGEFIEKRLLKDKMFISFRLHDVTIDENDKKEPEQLLRTHAPTVIQTFVEPFQQVQEVARNARTMSISELWAKMQRDDGARIKLLDEAKKRLGVLQKDLTGSRRRLEEIYNQDPSIPRAHREALQNTSAQAQVSKKGAIVPDTQDRKTAPGSVGSPALPGEQANLERRVSELGAQARNQEKRVRELETSKNYVLADDVYEFHKKFAIPFACFVFTIVGAPLGMFSRRSGRGMGFGWAIIVLIVYYVLLTLGQGWAVSNKLAPALSAWLPDIFLGIIGAFLVLKKLRE